jgi:hypothetical protein
MERRAKVKVLIFSTQTTNVGATRRRRKSANRIKLKRSSKQILRQEKMILIVWKKPRGQLIKSLQYMIAAQFS